MGRMALPFGVAGVAFKAMLSSDYYTQSIDKHLGWLSFNGAMGVCAANAVKVAFKASNPWRYVMQDIFVLCAYSFGYQMIPILAKDQLLQSAAGPDAARKLGLTNRDDLKLRVQGMGAMGIAYGAFILKATSLGFKMRETRSWLSLIVLAISAIGLPFAATEALFHKSKMRSFHEYNRTDNAFDPIDSYLKHLM